MKNLNFKSICAFAALFMFSVVSVFAQNQPQAIPGQYIVKMKYTANDLAATAENSTVRPTSDNDSQVKEKKAKNSAKVEAAQKRGGVQKSNVIHEYTNAMVGFAAKLNDDQVKKLKQDPDVEGVYPDYVVSLSPMTQEQNPSAQGQYLPCGITTSGGPIDGSLKATWIWILDTGIDAAHPDLNVQTNSYYAASFIAGQTVADGNGHGTHCAGIAAAKNNTIGVVGVSAGAKVVPVKVLSNTGSGSWSSIISGLNHVMSRKIAGDVVSMSLGGYGYANCENVNPTLRDAIRNLGLAGVHVVIASGNNGDPNGTPKTLPGCVNGTRVYTVGSITCSKTQSSFSNYGPGTDWVAVGSNVYSTYPGGGYATMSGTSMATPTVAGVIHARGGAPISGGTVTFSGGVVYNIARR